MPRGFFRCPSYAVDKKQVKTEPDFNLQAYLTMLLYYKTDMADLKFDEEEDKLLYKLKILTTRYRTLLTNLLKILANLLQSLPKKEKTPPAPPKMLMELLTPENIKSYFAAKDYKFFDSPDKRLNLNIIGVRRDNQGSNTFDDFLLVMYREEETMVSHRWQATTDPGKYWLMNPMNPKGTAVLVPGQYRGTWQLGKHQNNYEALVQSKPVKVWRDNNKDEVIDYENIKTMIDEGYFELISTGATPTQNLM